MIPVIAPKIVKGAWVFNSFEICLNTFSCLFIKMLLFWTLPPDVSVLLEAQADCYDISL